MINFLRRLIGLARQQPKPIEEARPKGNSMVLRFQKDAARSTESHGEKRIEIPETRFSPPAT
jgi:hypothetical protein